MREHCTVEFRIKCGDDVGRCALCEVLQNELVAVLPLSVPQFLIKGLYTTWSVAHWAGSADAGDGLTQASHVLLC